MDRVLSKRKEIKAVLFDWDLTIAQVLKGASESERIAALFQKAGLKYSATSVQAAIASYDQDASLGIVRSRRQAQTRQDIVSFYRQLLTRLGHPPVNWELGNILYSTYTYLPTSLYEDSMSTLRALKQRGLTLGIISNHSTSARPVMESYASEFIPSRHITISEELGTYKPAKTIFRRAAARVRTPPEACLFVGDNLRVDAIGAVKQGGFRAGLWLDRTGKGTNLPLPAGVNRISSLNEVLQYV